jgi:hypothetical protein
VIPLALTPRAGRAYAFRTVAQLGIRYRGSPLSQDGPRPPRRGPRAGDRLPDAPLTHGGQSSSLHAASAAPGWHLLLCGPVEAWPAAAVASIADAYPDLVTTHHVRATTAPGAMHDRAGRALRRLGLRATDAAAYLVRPDGHIGYRCGGPDLAGVAAYLERWVPTAPP